MEQLTPELGCKNPPRSRGMAERAEPYSGRTGVAGCGAKQRLLASAQGAQGHDHDALRGCSGSGVEPNGTFRFVLAFNQELTRNQASNGANLQWPKQLGLNNLEGCQPQGREAWIFAIVNAMPYFAASIIGCWLSDPVSEKFFGRRAPICLSAVIILASIIGSALTQTWQQLLGCRALLGIGMGLKAAVVPVFVSKAPGIFEKDMRLRLVGG